MNSRWLKYPVLLFIASIPLSKVWTLPATGTAIQPAELIFLCLLAILVLFERRFLHDWFLTLRQNASLLFLCLVSLGVGLYHFDLQTMIGGTATMYLILVSIVLYRLWKRFPEWRMLAMSAYITGCSVLALTALIGGIRKYIWGPAGDLALTQTMPWIGQIHRLTGWSETPTMLAMTLSPALVFYFVQKNLLTLHLIEKLTFGLIALAWLGSLSKSMVVLLIVSLAYWAAKQQTFSKRIGGFGLSLILLLFTLFALHFTFAQKEQKTLSPLVIEDPVFEWGDQRMYPTTYVLSHAISWKLGKQHFWTGIGQGQIVRYNRKISFADPKWQVANERHRLDSHNLWLGGFGAMGFPGLIVLVYLTYYVMVCIGKLIHLDDPIVKTSVIILLFWMTEGLVTDVLHFRPAWIFLSFGMASYR